MKANKQACQEQFSDLALALDRSEDLEKALVKLYKDLNMPTRLRDFEIPEEDLKRIAFETSNDVVNLASNPSMVDGSRILEVLRGCY